jgi:hypothetical protein
VVASLASRPQQAGEQHLVRGQACCCKRLQQLLQAARVTNLVQQQAGHKQAQPA